MSDDRQPAAPLRTRRRRAAAARETIAADIQLLNSLGYGQELLRRMSGFSNFAISLSIICIVAGGITSFPQGFSSVGGAAIGLGWPACCLLSLCVALAMAQVASAFPTAGGLYHWAAILGGRGWGWLTAWFNLAGLITVLAAINVGTYQFASARAGQRVGRRSRASWTRRASWPRKWSACWRSPARRPLFNHLGIRLTAALTDFSGYWILLVAVGADRGHAGLRADARLLAAGHVHQLQRHRPAATSGPQPSNVALAVLAGLSVAGLHGDRLRRLGPHVRGNRRRVASRAARHRPLGAGLRRVRLDHAVGRSCWPFPTWTRPPRQGSESFHWIVGPGAAQAAAGARWRWASSIAQFFCGLATVTSASRMAYAFARDGGLPYRRAHAARQPQVSHAGRGDLDRGAVVGGVRRPHADLFDDHRRPARSFSISRT